MIFFKVVRSPQKIISVSKHRKPTTCRTMMTQSFRHSRPPRAHFHDLIHKGCTDKRMCEQPPLVLLQQLPHHHQSTSTTTATTKKKTRTNNVFHIMIRLVVAVVVAISMILVPPTKRHHPRPQRHLHPALPHQVVVVATTANL